MKRRRGRAGLPTAGVLACLTAKTWRQRRWQQLGSAQLQAATDMTVVCEDAESAVLVDWSCREERLHLRRAWWQEGSDCRQGQPRQTQRTIALKPYIKRRKDRARCKPLPPSKRLRLEAQRVLKDRVQDIADKKGIKLRFCNLKDCEGHMKALDSPCASIRTEIGWPREVPFVHPHDLPNKAKLRFLEAYEPGWTDSQPDMENQSP